MLNHVLTDLRRIAGERPDKLAFSDGEEGLTFSQLRTASWAVGSELYRRGIYHQPVAVFMRRSPQEIAAFFGAIAAGCFYVPLDEEMPATRIQLILDNIHAPMIICDEDSLPLVEQFDLCGAVPVLYGQLAGTAVDEAAIDRIYTQAIDTDPIYVVFTSGSTGVPKGVVACHRSVTDYVSQLSEVMEFDGDTIFGNQAPLYFDACLKELYPTLKFGATTYLIPRRLFSFPVALIDYLNDHKINTICWVASALTLVSSLGTFDTIRPKYLRRVAFGSEVFPPKHLRAWREAAPQATFTNLYGPTEGTGMCCYYRVDRDFSDQEVIPIGRPFPNRAILLLTPEGRAANGGEVGEIFIRGTAVTMGYYNDPSRTAGAYIQNPLQTAYPEIIYKTGDLGRRNDRGELLYVSRKDHQIKHMGHRVELGEIEAGADQVPGISLAAAIYDEERDRIALYYSGTLKPCEVSAALRKKLPRYMLPARLCPLESLPLTPNGKIDRVSLRTLYGESTKRRDG